MPTLRITTSMPYLGGVTSLSLLLVVITALSGCTRDKSLIEEIKEKKQLVVVTRNSPTTYYIGPFGPKGLEYDLATLFAQRLGVELKIVVEENLSKMFALIKDGEADIAAAGLTITKSRRKFLQFSPSYQEVTQKLIYRVRNNRKRPRKIKDLIGADIDVVANSSHAETLKKLKKKHPELVWHENTEMDSDDLLQLVWSQFIDYTIADSNEITLSQRFWPELHSAFNVSKPEKLAWALQKNVDDTLYNETIRFFGEIRKNGKLKQLLNKYYGHTRNFNYVGTQSYVRDIVNILPKYADSFKAAAKEFDIDWRLLAAVGYQESHWNPKAVSPTGVRGIMMLTIDTAKFIKIKDRNDPEQSVYGGAKYLRYMIDKIPPRITEPDRTWMAMAAYNVGFGHLEDARIITEKQGGNPDLWVDVRERLPLLSKKKWYQQTRNGYARGREPVGYVANIRNYFEILVWHDESGSETYTEQIPIQINSPAL